MRWSRSPVQSQPHLPRAQTSWRTCPLHHDQRNKGHNGDWAPCHPQGHAPERTTKTGHHCGWLGAEKEGAGTQFHHVLGAARHPHTEARPHPRGHGLPSQPEKRRLQSHPGGCLWLLGGSPASQMPAPTRGPQGICGPPTGDLSLQGPSWVPPSPAPLAPACPNSKSSRQDLPSMAVCANRSNASLVCEPLLPRTGPASQGLPSAPEKWTGLLPPRGRTLRTPQGTRRQDKQQGRRFHLQLNS